MAIVLILHRGRASVRGRRLGRQHDAWFSAVSERPSEMRA